MKCFGFIAAEKAKHAISLMCRVLGVSRSGFHAWERRNPSRRAEEDARLSELIRESHKRGRGTYGLPGSIGVCAARASAWARSGSSG